MRLNMMSKYIKKILSAPVYDVAEETPVDHAPLMSERLSNQVYIKREDLQSIFSFKIRGAYNKIVHLSDEEKQRGVIAASAGNHAQGVALAAQKLGIKATIVMPVTTPSIKVQSVQKKGAEVVLHGDSFDDAYQHSLGLAKEKGLVFIHPFDDEDVIAGQGTVAMEIGRQCTQHPDYVFIPVGGGGLIAGVTAYLKFINPDIKIIAVEPEDSACLKVALEKGEPTRLEKVSVFADGVAVKEIGPKCFDVVKDNVDGIVTVTTDEICAALKDVYDDTRAISEPAGAVGMAGLKKYVEEHGPQDKKLLTIISGANMNFDRLRHIAERTQIGEKREAIFAVTIPEIKGSFRKLCAVLDDKNITEFNYRYYDDRDAHVFIGIEMHATAENRGQVIFSLKGNGYKAIDMSDDETAKVHIRHMVGGKSSNIGNEHLFSFEFPERPGALSQFLQGISEDWNISLFHYRNHGAAYGRVLIGLQFPEGDKVKAKDALDALGYAFVDVTDNEAYRVFL